MLSGIQPRIKAAVAYNAADPVSQELSGWHPRMESADSAWLPNKDKVTARIRDLVRNDGWASGGVTRYLDSVIGAGLRLSAKPDYRALGLSHEWAAEFAKYVESQWRSFGDDVERYSDAARHNTMGGLFGLAFRHKLIDGDAVAIAHHLPKRGGKFATAIQVINPDRLSNENNGPDTKTLRGGVVKDKYGAATAYWFRNAHPAETGGEAMDFTWTRLPRQTKTGRPIVIHDYNLNEAGQTRGVSKLAPVVERLKMLTKMDKVELQAAVINATIATYITSPMDHSLMQSALEDDNNGEISGYQLGRSEFHDESNLRLNGARIPVLYPGEEINGVDSNRSGSSYADYEEQALRNIASGIGISYEQLSSDWSKTNYSSARAALLEVWRTLHKEREQFAQSFCGRIYSVFLEELFDRGDLPLPPGAPGFYEDKAAYCRSKWIGPPRGWVDPVKEGKAAVMRMTAGLSTLEAECAEQGQDWEEVLDQRAIENRRWKKLGLPDPNVVLAVRGDENVDAGNQNI